jgi:hypothetical protein
VCLTIVMAACAGPPRTRPLQTKPADEGAGTSEGVRKQFAGRWTLLSLTMHDVGGRSAPIDADGQLVSDAFANMKVEYRLSETGLKTLGGLGIKSPNAVITMSGKVVYTLEPDGTLRLSTRYDNGKDASVSRWKKGS